MAVGLTRKKWRASVFIIGLALLLLIPTGYFAYWYFRYTSHRG